MKPAFFPATDSDLGKDAQLLERVSSPERFKIIRSDICNCGLSQLYITLKAATKGRFPFLCPYNTPDYANVNELGVAKATSSQEICLGQRYKLVEILDVFSNWMRNAYSEGAGEAFEDSARQNIPCMCLYFA